MTQQHNQNQPWYAGEHQDALFYLLIAIFFIEMIVGGIAFFYGIIHASPEVSGGPPIARFPWLAWSIAAILAPVAFLLVVNLAGSWVSNVLTRENSQSQKNSGESSMEQLPPRMRHLYASVRHAPTIVILLGILMLGAALFFVEGAFNAMINVGMALIPYIPWIAGSAAALLAVCFLIHAIARFRQKKMENEYAWRREVLEKTGLVLTDKNSIALPQNETQKAALIEANNLPVLPEGQNIIDVISSEKTEEEQNNKPSDL